MADLGLGPPLFWVKKKESQKGEKPAGQVNHPPPPPPRPLAQGLDLPLRTINTVCDWPIANIGTVIANVLLSL